MKIFFGRLRMLNKKPALKKLINYLTGEASIKVLGIFSIPILTRMLTPSDYGLLSVFNSFVSLIIIIQSLNLQSSLRPRYLKNNERFDEYLSSSLIGSTIFSLFFFSLLLIYSKYISSVFKLPDLLFRFALIATTISVIREFLFRYFLTLEKSKEYSIHNFIYNFLSIGLSIGIIYLLKNEKYLGRAYAVIISSFIYVFISISFLKKSLVFKFNRSFFLHSLLFSAPLILHSSSHFILSQFDKFIINQLIDSDSTGIYSIAYSVGNLLMVATIAVNNSWLPIFFKRLNQKKYKQINKDLFVYLNIVLFSALILSLFGQEAIYILATKDYYDGIELIPIITLANLFIYFYMLYANYSFYSEKTILIATGTIISGGVNIFLNYLLIPTYGYKIAAFTTLVSYVLLFILHYANSKYILKKEVLSQFILFKELAIYMGGYFLIKFLAANFNNLVLIILIKIAAVSIFGLIKFRKHLARLNKNFILEK